MDSSEQIKQFFLLQINDALFPVGGYSHSFGMETYIQNGVVHDAKSAEEYLKANFGQSFLYGDLLCVRLAWELAYEGDVDGLAELEEIALASKSPEEIREASHKIGSRFIKTVRAMTEPHMWQNSVFDDYVGRIKKDASHAVAYGVCCASMEISRENALYAYLYAQVSAMLTCCVKAVPLSQTDGQKILFDLFGMMSDMLKKVEQLDGDDVYRSSPAFDIRSMEHEVLYSRLFMS